MKKARENSLGVVETRTLMWMMGKTMWMMRPNAKLYNPGDGFEESSERRHSEHVMRRMKSYFVRRMLDLQIKGRKLS